MHINKKYSKVPLNKRIQDVHNQVSHYNKKHMKLLRSFSFLPCFWWRSVLIGTWNEVCDAKGVPRLVECVYCRFLEVLSRSNYGFSIVAAEENRVLQGWTPFRMPRRTKDDELLSGGDSRQGCGKRTVSWKERRKHVECHMIQRHCNIVATYVRAKVRHSRPSPPHAYVVICLWIAMQSTPEGTGDSRMAFNAPLWTSQILQ